jgi:hypothetical protein
VTDLAAGPSAQGLENPDSDRVSWTTLSEALMRGLVHALNNRVAALSALSELVALGDDGSTTQRILPSELARLQQVNVLFRLLLTEELPMEAMELAPVLDDALALHAHHSRLRTVRCDVVREGNILPLRVPRSSLLRLLLLLLEHGKRHAESLDTAVTVLHVRGTEASISLTVSAVEGPCDDTRALTVRCGGTLESGDGEIIVHLPTLLELRRNERAKAANSTARNELPE